MLAESADYAIIEDACRRRRSRTPQSTHCTLPAFSCVLHMAAEPDKYLAVLKASYDYEPQADAEDEIAIKENQLLFLLERTDEECDNPPSDSSSELTHYAAGGRLRSSLNRKMRRVLPGSYLPPTSSRFVAPHCLGAASNSQSHYTGRPHTSS